MTERLREYEGTGTFFVLAGEEVVFRGERRTVESSDSYARQCRLHGDGRTDWVPWDRCRVVRFIDEAEAQPEQAEPAPKARK